MDIPNPGSREAIDAGCACAVIDNGRGRGYMGQPGIFVVSADCPVHGIGFGVQGGFLAMRKALSPSLKEQEP